MSALYAVFRVTVYLNGGAFVLLYIYIREDFYLWIYKINSIVRLKLESIKNMNYSHLYRKMFIAKKWVFHDDTFLQPELARHDYNWTEENLVFGVYFVKYLCWTNTLIKIPNIKLKSSQTNDYFGKQILAHIIRSFSQY